MENRVWRFTSRRGVLSGVRNTEAVDSVGLEIGNVSGVRSDDGGRVKKSVCNVESEI